MRAIEGKDVLLEFYKGDGYKPFICAETISIRFTATTISTKTKGSGNWEEYIQGTKGYTVSCGGIIPFDMSGVTVWDLYDFFDQMTDAPFRMIFRDTNDNLIKCVIGNVLVSEIDISAPMDFVGASLQFIGNGKPTIANNLSGCQASITSLSQNSQTTTYISFQVSGFSSDTRRIEYSVDGGGRRSMVITPGALLKLIGYQKYSQISAGDHTLTVWPMCESGDYGTAKTLNFTVT